MSEKKKINEKHFDEGDGIGNYLKASSLSFSHGELHLSLTGGGMDFFIKSGYDGDSWTWSALDDMMDKFETKDGKLDKEAMNTARKKIVDEVDALDEKALKDFQEIIDTYMTLLEARMRKFDQEKQAIKKKYGQ